MLRIFDALIDGDLKVDTNGEFRKCDLVKIDKEDVPKYFSNKGLKNLIDAYLLISVYSTKGYKLHPNSIEMLFDYGLWLKFNGNQDLAGKCFELCLNLRPTTKVWFQCIYERFIKRTIESSDAVGQAADKVEEKQLIAFEQARVEAMQNACDLLYGVNIKRSDRRARDKREETAVIKFLFSYLGCKLRDSEQLDFEVKLNKYSSPKSLLDNFYLNIYKHKFLYAKSLINNLRLQLGNYSEWEPFWELIKVLLNEASDVQRKKNEQFDVKILELIENEKWQEIVEFLEENTYEGQLAFKSSCVLVVAREIIRLQSGAGALVSPIRPAGKLVLKYDNYFDYDELFRILEGNNFKLAIDALNFKNTLGEDNSFDFAFFKMLCYLEKLITEREKVSEGISNSCDDNAILEMIADRIRKGNEAIEDVLAEYELSEEDVLMIKLYLVRFYYYDMAEEGSREYKEDASETRFNLRRHKGRGG